MRIDIRFAGMALGWTKQYAVNYGDKLKEMGYCIRIADMGESALIAYSHRTFTMSEMDECLGSLDGKIKQREG